MSQDNTRESSNINYYDKEIPWVIIESYFKNKHLKQLVKHQIESYNQFVNVQIKNTIDMFNPLHIVSENDYVKEHNLYRLEIFINFENLAIHRPQVYENNGATKVMFPNDARLRNFTYASNLLINLNIKYVIRNGDDYKNTVTYNKYLQNIYIGKLPVMLRSEICVLNQYKNIDLNLIGECKMDPGGYFIINGSEKTILGQERAAENQIYCFNISKNNTKWRWMAEMKCVPDWKIISPKQISVLISQKSNEFGNPIYVQIPRLKNPIPLFVMFRAFNIISDRDICKKITLDIDNLNDDKIKKRLLYSLKASIADSNSYLSYDCAIKYITNNVLYTPINIDKELGNIKKKNFALEVINNDIFPQCKTDLEKIYMLGYITNLLLKASFGIIPESDRDSYINKRIDLAGSLINNLFRNYFNKLVKDMQKQIVKEINNGSWKSSENYENIINTTNIYKIVKPSTIENGIKRALATGDFGIKQINSNKVGVAQVLNRLTYISSLSHLRRINTPIDKSGKLVPPRRLHNSSWGFLCPAETPEGASIGIVKNLSYLAHITIPSSSASIYNIVLPMVKTLDVCSSINIYDYVKVFINGTWIGVTDDPVNLYDYLKTKKLQGIFNIYTSIIFDTKLLVIRVCNDAGRLCRPVFRVKDNNLLYTNNIINRVKNSDLKYDDLLISCKIDDAIIEYIDSYEQNYSMIAVKTSDILNNNTIRITSNNSSNIIYKYTHCEIHPSSIFGILASCIPFPENNQSPRNTYQCLDINTPVLMKNQSYKLIKDIKVGDLVQTFHPVTMKTSYTKIVNQYVRKTEKVMYNVTTYSGKSFNATFDHKFMTYNGWKEVENLQINNDLIGIKPALLEFTHNINDTQLKLILNRDDFNVLLTQNNDDKNISKTLVDKYIIRLENNGLLPLYNNNSKLPILARMFGFILAVGSLRYHNIDRIFILQTNFWDKCAAELFELDIEDLGFSKLKIIEDTRQNDGYHYGMFTIRENSCLAALFKALGMLVSNETSQSGYDIPSWIKDGSDLVKREFLSGIQGGAGCQIRFSKVDNKYNYSIGPLDISNKFWDKTSLIKVLTSVSELFNYLKIKNNVCCKFNSEHSSRNTNGLIVFSNSKSNLINYFDKIGYKYDTYKITQSAIIIEYLKYKKSLIKTNNNCEEKNIENFVNMCKIINDAIFVPIKTKNQISMNIIADITTQSDNHSFFIKDGLMTHNSAMGKQAMGVYVTNYDDRMDKTAYVLSYPMRPLVDTRIMNIIQLNKIPSGEQVIVAIISYTGYNQEDSILFNKGSIDRGLFASTIYHTEKDEDKKIFGNQEIRCKPDKSKTKNIKFANYDKLNENGILDDNTLVEDRDIIISKILPIKENKNDFTKVIKYQDESRIYRTNEETFVDKSYIGYNGDGYNFCKIRLRNFRKPTIGDKFSSRHGQKGTIGNIIPEEDMPFTSNGLRPDIIINPHAIPSRMTIAQLKETVMGKILLQLGLFGDGTSFGDFTVDALVKKLQNQGFESHGNELLYNGFTGEQLASNIFIGPAFYQRLKHMVNDKQHSRSIGPMVNLTRQPAEGRSRDGGLRFGEMERDAMVSHGASRFIKDRLYNASDAFSINICANCGLIAHYNDKEHIHFCKICNNRTDFKYVELPYSCKLLFQELQTMNVAPRILCE
tara:strand:- start:20724 stop:25679 length:4956 start_codon:yes stop_codon:yes gene_type:complete